MCINVGTIILKRFIKHSQNIIYLFLIADKGA